MGKPAHLARRLNLPLMILYGLGTIIGAGVYVLVGKISGVSGYYTPFAFLFASTIALFTGISYAELSSKVPTCGGEADYIKKAFNKDIYAITTGLLVATTGIVSAATISKGLTGYVSQFAPITDPTCIFISIALMVIIACVGIFQSVMLAAAISVLEIGGLLYILIYSFPEFSKIPMLITEAPPFDHLQLLAVINGGFIAFYAFIGFEDMVNVAEEVIHPQKTLPKAIVAAILISATLYVLISLAALAVLTPSELNNSSAPLADMIVRLNNHDAKWISLISIVAVFNGGLIQIIMASRIIFSLSRSKHLPNFLNSIHPKTKTPINATLVVGIFTLLSAFLLPLVTLAKATSFIILIVFLFVNLALLKIKKSHGRYEGTVNYPRFFPITGAILCFSILVYQVVIILN